MAKNFGNTARALSRSLALSAVLAVAGAASVSAQQQQQRAPAAPPAAAPPPAAQPAAKAATPAPAQAGAPQSAWVKLCEKAPFAGKDAAGKEVKTEKSICLTHHERIDGNSGMVLVSAAIRQIEGEPKSHLMVMVPLGMALSPGMQIGVYAKDLWEKVQKGEKVDDTKLKPIKLAYALCHAAGCTAEAETTPEILAEIKGGSGMIVYALNGNGAPVAFPVPLNGFDVALNGKAVDNAEYTKARQQLMKQIADRQREQYEQYKKQNDELQKMQGNQAQGTAAPATGANPPARAPAAGQPPPKKN